MGQKLNPFDLNFSIQACTMIERIMVVVVVMVGEMGSILVVLAQVVSGLLRETEAAHPPRPPGSTISAQTSPTACL